MIQKKQSEVVVLGPTGNIGSALAQILMNEKVSFRTGNRKDFNYFDPKTYLPLMEGATHLFLVVPIVESLVEVVGLLTETARKAGMKKIVKISALGASLDSPSRVLRWHAESDFITARSGIDTVCLRPNGFMQNFIQFYGRSIREARLLAIPADAGRVSFIDAGDIARVAAHELFSLSSESTLDLTGPESLNFQEIAEKFSSRLGLVVRYLNPPPENTKEKLRLLGTPEWFCDALLELYSTYRAGAAAKVTTTVKDLTGTPAVNLETFILNNQRSWL